MTAVLVAFLIAGPASAGGRELRVCADPNNLPFSNARREGFENQLADLLARELQATVRYTWWAQRRGFIRNTLNAGLCDVVLGVPLGFDPVLTTRAYYRSSYGFLSRRDRALALGSLEDPRLAELRIGVHLVGGDNAATPPAYLLARRGLVDNVVGYTVYGDYREPNPPARLVEAVAHGDVDVALVWGPLAGYFASRQAVPLEFVPVMAAPDSGPLPLTFAIAAGVRKGDVGLRDALDRALERKRPAIEMLLDGYGVPRLPPGAPGP